MIASVLRNCPLPFRGGFKNPTILNRSVQLSDGLRDCPSKCLPGFWHCNALVGKDKLGILVFSCVRCLCERRASLLGLPHRWRWVPVLLQLFHTVIGYQLSLAQTRKLVYWQTCTQFHTRKRNNWPTSENQSRNDWRWEWNNNNDATSRQPLISNSYLTQTHLCLSYKID